MNKIIIILNKAREILINNKIDEREARLLLAFAMGINSDELIRYTEVSDDIKNKFNEILNKRISGIPFAYITGSKEFMKLNFKVNENVLIPRPETELLVEEAIKTNAIKVLDMCTGSGCIAIAIAYYNQDTKVTAADISPKALEIARENAKNNKVNVEFIESNLFENIKEKYDLIVSNPPYIKTEVIEKLQAEVKSEPLIALDGGESGLEFYEKIVTKAKEHLTEQGILMLEIGYDQAREVKEMLEKNNYKNIEIKQDLANNNRVIICKK